MNDTEKAAEADFKMAVLYVKSGYEVESGDILERYRGKEIPDGVLRDYYCAEHVYWGETMAYAATSESCDDRLSKRDAFRELLL